MKKFSELQEGDLFILAGRKWRKFDYSRVQQFDDIKHVCIPKWGYVQPDTLIEPVEEKQNDN